MQVKGLQMMKMVSFVPGNQKAGNAKRQQNDDIDLSRARLIVGSPLAPSVVQKIIHAARPADILALLRRERIDKGHISGILIDKAGHLHRRFPAVKKEKLVSKIAPAVPVPVQVLRKRPGRHNTLRIFKQAVRILVPHRQIAEISRMVKGHLHVVHVRVVLPLFLLRIQQLFNFPVRVFEHLPGGVLHHQIVHALCQPLQQVWYTSIHTKARPRHSSSRELTLSSSCATSSSLLRLSIKSP